VFWLRNGRVFKLTLYEDRARAYSDLGLEPDASAKTDAPKP
jgi:hypothetical protein